jgi:hypothetical protein
MKSLQGTILLGIKISFKDIWEKVGTVTVPSCYCDGNDPSKPFCPICGTKNKERIIPQYHNLLTHTISSCRDIDSMFDILDKTNISIFDNSPDGYTDDPVFLFLKTPNCKVEISSTDPVKFYLFDHGFDVGHIQDELKKSIHETLYTLGDFGLWFIPHNLHRSILAEENNELISRIDNLLSSINDSKIYDT